MSRRILATTVAGLAAAGLDAVFSWTPAAVVGAVVLVGALGYLVAAALHPSGVLSWTERALWSAGLAMVAVTADGFFLDGSGLGLHRGSWIATLAVLTLGAGWAAWWRQRDANLTRQTHLLPFRLGAIPRRAALFGIAALMAGGALWISQSSAASVARQPAFTQLWLTRDTPGVPTGDALLGVRSDEHATTTYLLQLSRDATPSGTWTLRLHPGQQWETTIPAPSGQIIVASLYRSTQPGKVYRQVDLRPLSATGGTGSPPGRHSG